MSLTPRTVFVFRTRDRKPGFGLFVEALEIDKRVWPAFCFQLDFRALIPVNGPNSLNIAVFARIGILEEKTYRFAETGLPRLVWPFHEGDPFGTEPHFANFDTPVIGDSKPEESHAAPFASRRRSMSASRAAAASTPPSD